MRSGVGFCQGVGGVAAGFQGADYPIQTTAPEIVYKDWVNKRTGEVIRHPVGIDPGWDYNVGMAG